MSKAKVKIDQITCSECNSVDNNIEQKESLRKKSKEGTYATLSKKSNDASHTYHQGDEYLELQVSHLDASQNNVFKLNDLAENCLPGLFLTIDSMKQLTCSQHQGWLNDILMT